jgi:hypothetical protein
MKRMLGSGSNTLLLVWTGDVTGWRRASGS